MANFATLTAGLNLNTSNFSSNLIRANSQVQRFAANLSGQINAGMVDPAKRAKFEFKDVARIVQGIIISKAFYGGLNAIRQATSAVWSFSQQLEYAQMVYTNLFGSSSLATEFINVLKDFAAITPFAFSDAEEAAKRLLAYGIKSQNVMYVMQGVLAASTAQQNPAIIEQVSRAMGQIYTKGRLMNEEMRQLAEAGIPAYEILQQKLGLTQKQLQNLGKQAIPANVAINALVDGINERFGGLLSQASKTITGLISNIKDNAQMLASGLFTPVASQIRTALVSLESFVSKLREAYELRGAGGVFEQLVPKDMQASIRTLLLNLRNLNDIIKMNVGNLLNFAKAMLAALVPILNVVLPPLNILLGLLTALTRAITSNETAMKIVSATIFGAAAAWAVYKIHALAAVASAAAIKLIVGAVKTLSVALTFLATHPVWALLAFGVGVFITLTGASNRFAQSVKGIFGALTSLGGINPAKTLLPESKQRANDLGKFNSKLTETSDAMDDLAGKTGKAAKAAKTLLGFDEVFNLNTPDEGDADGIGTDVDDLIPNAAGMDFSDFWKDTDFNKISQNFVDGLLDAFGGKNKVISAGIGTIIGGALGMLLGGPLGAKIGMVVGAIAGYFWDDLADALGLSDVGKIAIPITTALGTAIGFIVGGPVGAVVGTAIGLLVGWIIDEIAKGFETGDWSGVALPVGIGLGAGIGLIVGGPAGAALGAVIGGLVGWVVKKIMEGFTTGKWDLTGISTGIGTLIGGGIGFVMGGPAGALIGIAAGALVGWVIGKFTEADWGAVLESFAKPWEDFAGEVQGWFSDYVWDPISEAFESGDWLKIGASIIAGVLSGLIGALVAIPLAIGTFFQSVWNAICEIFGIHSPAETMKPIGANIVLGMLEGLLATVPSFLEGLGTFGAALFTNLGTWFQKSLDSAKEKFTEIKNAVLTNLTGAKDTAVLKGQEIWTTISEKFSGAATSAKENFESMRKTLSDKLVDMGTTAKEGVGKIYDTFKGWISNMWDNIFNKFFGWIDDAIEKLQDFFDMEDDAKSSKSKKSSGTSRSDLPGHAVGGIFTREHIARFAEGNKAEMAIPLENAQAMQPFVNAISDGITQSLMPALANTQMAAPAGTQQGPLMQVGVLVADDRGLRELEKRLERIRTQDDARKGLQ